ncbi:ATP-binding cassette, sub-B (MDR TAP), member 4, partial [Quaeritorhiza haematococci]
MRAGGLYSELVKTQEMKLKQEEESKKSGLAIDEKGGVSNAATSPGGAPPSVDVDDVPNEVIVEDDSVPPVVYTHEHQGHTEVPVVGTTLPRVMAGAALQRTSTITSVHKPSSPTSDTDHADHALPTTGSQNLQALLNSKDSEVKARAERELLKQRSVSFARVLSYNAPEWYLFIVGGLAACVNGIVMPCFALVFSEILEVFGKTGDDLRNGANFWALMFLVLAVAAFVSNLAQVTSFTMSGEKLTRRLRDMCFRSLLRQEIGFFDDPNHSTGILTARLADDAAKVQGLCGQLIGTLIQSFANIVAGLVIAFVNGWELTLVVLATIPMIGAGGMLEFKALQGFGSITKKAYNKANQTAAEAILNIRTVVTLNKEDTFFSEYESGVRRPHIIALRGSFISALGFGFSQSIQFFAFSLAFWYGARLIENGRSDAVSVMTVMFSVIFAAMTAGQAASFVPNMASAQVAAISIFDILDRSPKIDYTKEDGVRKSKKEVVGKAE